jgi:hypothetical protein
VEGIGKRKNERLYLVTNDGLLDSSEVLKGRQQNVTPLRTANILDKATKLLAQGNKDLVFIFHRLCKASRLGEVYVWVATWCAGKIED